MSWGAKGVQHTGQTQDNEDPKVPGHGSCPVTSTHALHDLGPSHVMKYRLGMRASLTYTEPSALTHPCIPPPDTQTHMNNGHSYIITSVPTVMCHCSWSNQAGTAVEHHSEGTFEDHSSD